MIVNCADWIDIGVPNTGRCAAFGRKLVGVKKCVACTVRKPMPLAALSVRGVFIGPPRPPKLWPTWAQLLRDARRAGEAGVGDTAEWEIGRLGLVGFEVAYNVNFGPTCGCHAKEWGEAAHRGWNRRYPYAAPATAAAEGHSNAAP